MHLSCTTTPPTSAVQSAPPLDAHLTFSRVAPLAPGVRLEPLATVTSAWRLGGGLLMAAVVNRHMPGHPLSRHGRIPANYRVLFRWF